MLALAVNYIRWFCSLKLVSSVCNYLNRKNGFKVPREGRESSASNSSNKRQSSERGSYLNVVPPLTLIGSSHSKRFSYWNIFCLAQSSLGSSLLRFQSYCNRWFSQGIEDQPLLHWFRNISHYWLMVNIYCYTAYGYGSSKYSAWWWFMCRGSTWG